VAAEKTTTTKTVDEYDLKRKQIENEVKTILQKRKGLDTIVKMVGMLLLAYNLLVHHSQEKLLKLARHHYSLVKLVHDVYEKSDSGNDDWTLRTKAKGSDN